jgi:DNA-binding MarR family transcriptional regulator
MDLPMGDVKAVSRRRVDIPDAFVPLERSLGYHVRQLAETWQDVMEHEGDLRGVTVSQWRYLRELWEQDGLTSGELTRRVRRQGPTTVVAVQGLERAGFVRVVKSRKDRRKSIVYLTTRGRRMARTMAPAIEDVNERAVANLTEGEIRTFKQLIVRIQRTLDGESRHRNEWAEKRTDRLAQDVGL